VNVSELKLLLALEPSWTASVNGKEFLHLRSSEIEIEGARLRFGRFSRNILSAQYIRANAVHVRVRSRLRSQTETITFYAGEILPSAAELQRRRRLFQRQLAPAITGHFGERVVSQTLHSDNQHGIGGAYPRFLVGKAHAVIAVDPDEAAPTVNGIMRSAVQWAAVAKRRISVVVPAQRSQTIAARLRAIPALRSSMEWLEWDGDTLQPLRWNTADLDTQVYPCVRFDSLSKVQAEVDRILALAPELLQAVPHIAARAISIRLRGLEVARVSEHETTYPLGEPLDPLIASLAEARRPGSRHLLARAHEEAWLESNLIGQIRDLLPVRPDFIYPQVPSFAGGERKIIDLLTVTDAGRLTVIEIKASADPDLPFQAFDYWLAVERHRKAGDFKANGYFGNMEIREQPALLVMVAPLLSFHRTQERLTALLPAELPLMQIGINQSWKKEIKVLRRKGALG
jgi:hypothetical protein